MLSPVAAHGCVGRPPHFVAACHGNAARFRCPARGQINRAMAGPTVRRCLPAGRRTGRRGDNNAAFSRNAATIGSAIPAPCEPAARQLARTPPHFVAACRENAAESACPTRGQSIGPWAGRRCGTDCSLVDVAGVTEAIMRRSAETPLRRGKDGGAGSAGGFSWASVGNVSSYQDMLIFHLRRSGAALKVKYSFRPPGG